MVISSFISSILILALGIWAYMRLESSMNLFAEKQLLIEPSRFSYKMWKEMPVSMYQSFTFFNLTNWNQVKSIGQKPRFVEVGPYVYKTVWSKSDVNFFDDDKQVSFAEKKQWHFQAQLSRGHEDDLIWTINTPLMTALALIQNAPVITRNIVSVILDGLGEGAFIKRPIRSLLFEGYSDLIVSVGPLFDRRFANFNGKFAYLYNKNDTIDGHWTVSTGQEDLASLNKINRFQSSIVNMTSFSSGQLSQGLNEVKPECAPAWSLDQSTNGQLFAPFNRDIEQLKLQQQLQQIKLRASKVNEQSVASSQQTPTTATSNQRPSIESTIVQAPKRFFSRISGGGGSASSNSNQNPNPASQPATSALSQQHEQYLNQQQQLSVLDKLQQLRDFGKFIFYPDLCRPLHLLPAKQLVTSENGIKAARFFIDPRAFMNSTQVPSNKCYEMNPRPPLANALVATISSVTGANVNMPNLMPSGSSPFALFTPPGHHHSHYHNHHHHHPHGLFGQHAADPPHASPSGLGAGLFERSNLPSGSSFLNNALQSLSATANQAADQLSAAASTSQQNANSPIGRLSRVRQLFSNIVSQRMSGAAPLLPSLSGSPSGLLMGNSHHNSHQNFAGIMAPSFLSQSARNMNEHQPQQPGLHHHQNPLSRQASLGANGPEAAAQLLASPSSPIAGNHSVGDQPEALQTGQPNLAAPVNANAHSSIDMMPLAPGSYGALQSAPIGGSDRWITQFRFKWPRGVFSIGQCQLGAPIYVSLPHFLDADEYYLEQVDGLKPNRSLHEFYIDVESTLHSIPVAAKARLQLNVATPELRFRNIPNAMIPVLWQEVTFKLDKPVATLLYWSFTMSGSIYQSIGLLMIATGVGLLIFSLVATIKRQGRQQARVSSLVQDRLSGSSHSDRLSSVSSASCASSRRISNCSYSRRMSSPRFQQRRVVGGGSDNNSQKQAVPNVDKLKRMNSASAATAEGHRSSWQRVLPRGQAADILDEPQLRNVTMKNSTLIGVTNGAFVACNEMPIDERHHQRQFHDQSHHHLHHHHHCDDHRSSGSGVTTASSGGCPSASGTINGHRRSTSQVEQPSPKQPNDWSLASSHCELVSSSYGLPATIMNNNNNINNNDSPMTPARLAITVASSPVSKSTCSTNCLFTCLRHSPTRGAENGIQVLPSSIHHQREQASESLTTTTTSDIDTTKTTLSSTSSSSNSVGSCSSIIYETQKSRTFHKSTRASR